MFSFDHVAISVADLQASVDWYAKFGFKIKKEYHDDAVDIIHMKMSKTILEIFHDKNYKLLPKENSDLATVGNKHFGLYVKDIIKAKSWAISQGICDESVIIKEGRMGRQYFFLYDPNGLPVEIMGGKAKY